jgi:hypothetical protein
MNPTTKDLWQLVWGKPQVDPHDLAEAIAEQANREPLDQRTCLLIRDSVQALKEHWGTGRWQRWLRECPAAIKIEQIYEQTTGETGFSTIKARLMAKTDPKNVQQMFRELGVRVREAFRLVIGGSIALIMPGYLSRATEDIDVVDELPPQLRAEYALLDELKNRYGLLLTHFQSHYLPSGWEDRLHYFDTFGKMQVYLVDVYDIFLGKLNSSRSKDLDDLRLLIPGLDKETIVDLLKRTAGSLLASEALRKQAEQNWYILFGEELPQ